MSPDKRSNKRVAGVLQPRAVRRASRMGTRRRDIGGGGEQQHGPQAGQQADVADGFCTESCEAVSEGSQTDRDRTGRAA